MLLDKPDLHGLPDFFIASAKRVAADRGHPDKYAVTLSRSSIEPFLQFSGRRGPSARGFWATRPPPTTASPTRWPGRRGRRWICSSRFGRRASPARGRMRRRCRRLPLARAAISKVAPWDWRYLGEKRRKAEFDFDDGELKPYLQLDRLIQAAFYAASRLFGLGFAERFDLKLYHPGHMRCAPVRAHTPV
jgi:peptidyl-dipeptidase Dcp